MHFTQSGVIAIVGSGANDIKMSVWIFEYISNNDFPNVHTHIAWAERFFFSEIGTKPVKLSQKYAKADCKAAYNTQHILRFLNMVIYLQSLVYCLWI